MTFSGDEDSRFAPAHGVRNQGFPRRVRPAVIRPMSSPRDDRDYTPIVGAQTDIAPLGRSGPKPEHEKT
ncbi:MAG: hypothetical protein RIQ71_1745, partial [Verrucomicrobiota bacterium]